MHAGRLEAVKLTPSISSDLGYAVVKNETEDRGDLPRCDVIGGNSAHAREVTNQRRRPPLGMMGMQKMN